MVCSREVGNDNDAQQRRANDQPSFVTEQQSHDTSTVAECEMLI